jgi:hypothetical protein
MAVVCVCRRNWTERQILLICGAANAGRICNLVEAVHFAYRKKIAPASMFRQCSDHDALIQMVRPNQRHPSASGDMNLKPFATFLGYRLLKTDPSFGVVGFQQFSPVHAQRSIRQIELSPAIGRLKSAHAHHDDWQRQV